MEAEKMDIEKLDAQARTIRLSETIGMVKVIATAMIAQHGEYKCMIGGKPIRVVK